MVKRTYRLRRDDAEKLVSLACRYREIATSINVITEKGRRLLAG